MDARPNAIVKTDFKTLAVIIATTSTVTLWAYMIWSDVQRLKDDTKVMKHDIAEIRRAVAPMPVASAKPNAKDSTP